MATPILEISDGAISVNLIENINGFGVRGWSPAIAGNKSGGIWQNNPMADGRRLVIQNFDNTVETLSLTINGGDQDAVIEKSQKLRRLLQDARDYWVSNRNDANPVYIRARAPYETNTRYAIIYDWATPNDSNPFTMPFFNCGDSAMPEMTLVLERGHWMADAPLSSTCVLINNQQSYDESGAQSGDLQIEETTLIDTTDGGSESCGPNYDPLAVNSYLSAYEYVTFGAYNALATDYDFEFGLRFRNVNIPRNAYIDDAYVEFVAYANSSPVVQTARIYGEKVLNPSVFPPSYIYPSTALRTRYYGNADIPPVPKTANYVDWDIPELTGGNPYNTDSFPAIIQEIIDSSYWIQNTDIALYFHSQGNTPTLNDDDRKWFRAFLHPNDLPVLHIEYHIVEGLSYGQESTCASGSVMVANKHNRANISHLYRYDDSITTFSANLMQAGLPYGLLPATPAVDDLVYFGIDITLENSGPFCSLVFDIGTLMSDVAGVWEYYDGAAWSELPITDNTFDNAVEQQFGISGVGGVHWIQPSDWTVVTINGIDAYWVRFRVDVVGAAPVSPTQQNRLPYTVVTPFVDIDADEIGGDIPALSDVRLQNMSDDYAYDVKLEATRVIAALRSKERGQNFTPYINFGGQNITSCVITSLSDDFAFISTPLSPVGVMGQFTPAAAFPLAIVSEILFQGEELSNYIGTFRAFLRTREYGATQGEATARLAMRFGDKDPTFYTDEISIEIVDGYTITDMGLFVINPGTLNANELYTSGTIQLFLSCGNAAGTDLHVQDLILMPVDEWVCDTHSRSGEALRMFGWHGSQRELRIDGIGNPRFDTRCILVNDASEDLVLDVWPSTASSTPILQSNKDQRLWFLVFDTDRDEPDVCAFEACHAVRVFKNQRYFSMRGSR